MNDQLKKTPLYDVHVESGGKMVPFGGWNMPVQYSGLVDEHTAVRERVGLFDVSHMGEIRVTGPDAVPFVNYLCTNDAEKINDGQAQYTVLPYEDGTVVDDLLIYRFSAENLLLVVNASNIEKDYQWIRDHIGDFKVEVRDESDQTAQIAVQGPKAEALVAGLTDTDLSQIAYYHFTEGKVAGFPCIISRTGYTGEDGFELYTAATDAAELWRAVIDAGQPHGILPAGLGARDTLRLEARMHLYGNDMDNTTSVLEAGLGWATKFKKSSDFLGKQALLQQKKDGINRKLVGFELIDRGIARHGYPVVDSAEKEIGVVTSGSHSPTLKKSIGLAYVPSDLSKPGTRFHIKIRNKLATAEVVKGAFYKRSQD